VVGAVALVVILPWTIRNLLVLDKPVPVRTGFGQIAFVGTVALGGVLDPSTLRSQVLPPYQEGSTRRAVKKLLKAPFREIAQLEKFQLDYARELGGPGYENLNEAGRDDWFLKEAKAFLVGHPMLSMKLGLAKLEAFVRIYGRLGMVVCFLAAFGAIILFRTRAIVVLAVWVLGFVVPFLVAVCYYARYRSPIEPVMAVIAGLAIWSIVRTFIPAARRLELAPGAAT
jgi:hypothetical protein